MSAEAGVPPPGGGPPISTELVADEGAAAAGPHFFRGHEFLRAEGVTHSLRIRTGEGGLVAPVRVRAIEGGERVDAISPYGYPGLVPESPDDECGGVSCAAGGVSLDGRDAPGEPAPAPLDPSAIDFGPTGLVTAFIRHRLEPRAPLSGATARNVVQIADPELPRKSRMSDRQQIRKNARNGYEVGIVPGPEADARMRSGFLAAYEQTMVRAGAAERYFFSEEYFALILSSPLTWLVAATGPGGDVAAASIAAKSDGCLHYYLSGTADEHLRPSPMKNVVEAMSTFAAEHGLPLNLGGGITRGDHLEEFKRGFANREQQWFTSELVCDPEAYERLSPDGTRGDHFPAYRAA